MNRLGYFVKKLLNKSIETSIGKRLLKDENEFTDRYLREHSSVGKIKVCTYQTGFARHFTRFYNSSSNDDFCFYIVANPEDADVVVFINTIDSSVIRPGQQTILFFHEPKDYAHLYQTSIDWHKVESDKVQVVSHLPSPSIFIENPNNINFIRSIPYVHFHHMATYDELNTLDSIERKKQICSITSGFTGIPGYQKRRDFIEKLSLTNKNFDLYGRLSRQSAALPPYRGPCITKWKTLGDYRYSLVIENSSDDYYISEKIFDALICGCMPIYHGSSRIFEIIPKDWFYYLPTLDESEIKNLNRFLATDAYKVVSENRRKISETIYEKYSFYKALDNLLLGTKLSVIPT